MLEATLNKLNEIIEQQAKRIKELEEDYADLKKVQTADYNHAVRNAERIKKLEKEIDSQVDDEDGHHFGYLLGPCRD